MCVLLALRERLRSKEIWIEGANRYRNPDEDLPGDFDQERSTYYAALKLPSTAEDFIAGLKREMHEALTGFHDGLAANEYVKIEEKNRGRIRLSPLPVQIEPANLGASPLPDLMEVRVSNNVRATVVRRGLKEAWSKCASRWTRIGYKALASEEQATYREVHIHQRCEA